MVITKGNIAIKDSWAPRPLVDDRRSKDVDPVTILPDIDENGVAVYRDMPLQMFKHYAVAQPSRFVPYQTPPVPGVPIRRPEGKLDYVTVYPQYYEVKETDEGKEIRWYANDCKDKPFDYGPVQVTRFAGEQEALPKAEVAEEPTEPAETTEAVTEPEPEAEVAEEPKPAPQPKSAMDACRLKMKEAGEALGTDTVKEMEAAFRESIKKPKGSFNKKQAYSFIEQLDNAVKAKEANANE